MICPEELAILVNTAAVSLAQSVTNEELDILAAVFTQLGDTLSTISVQRQNIKTCCERIK